MKVMSGLDSRFLSFETPTAHMHTIKVTVIDVSARTTQLTPERMIEHLAESLERMPILRRRVVPLPFGLGNPGLIDDAHVDVSQHLRHVRAESPGGIRELAEVIAEVTARPLPRDRPLWELTVVDGLEGGQIGFVMKVHHALADGLASVSLLANAFELDDAIIEPFAPEPEPNRRALYRAVAGSLGEGLRSVPSVTRETVAGLRSQRTARRAESTRVMGPFAGPRTPFNVSLVPERTFAMFSFPIEAINPARRAVGASVNDAFLALCGGGIRRYLDRTGELPKTSLVASVPIGVPTDGPRLGGNRVDNLYVSLHTDVADPVERLKAIHASVDAARHVRGALGTGLFERRASLTPPILQAVIARGWAATGLAGRIRPPLNIVASSVPGPRTPLEINGGRITALYSSGPILEGIGLNITVWSYVDTMYVTLLGCPASLPDPWQLADDMDDERRALSAAADKAAEATTSESR